MFEDKPRKIVYVENMDSRIRPLVRKGSLV